jgi:hypothetical protein
VVTKLCVIQYLFATEKDVVALLTRPSLEGLEDFVLPYASVGNGSVDKTTWDNEQRTFSRDQSARSVALLKEQSLGIREPLRLVFRAREFHGAVALHVQKLTREVLESHNQYRHKAGREV